MIFDLFFFLCVLANNKVRMTVLKLPVWIHRLGTFRAFQTWELTPQESKTPSTKKPLTISSINRSPTSSDWETRAPLSKSRQPRVAQTQQHQQMKKNWNWSQPTLDLPSLCPLERLKQSWPKAPSGCYCPLKISWAPRRPKMPTLMLSNSNDGPTTEPVGTSICRPAWRTLMSATLPSSWKPVKSPAVQRYPSRWIQIQSLSVPLKFQRRLPQSKLH